MAQIDSVKTILSGVATVDKVKLIWEGTITALTTGEFLYLPGSSPPKQPFEKGALYWGKITIIAKDLNSDFIRTSDDIIRNNRKITRRTDGTYPSEENVLNTTISYAEGGRTNSFQMKVYNTDKIRVECVANNNTEDRRFWFIYSIDERIDYNQLTF